MTPEKIYPRRINTDKAPQKLESGEVVDLVNLRPNSPESSEGWIVTLKGTKDITESGLLEVGDDYVGAFYDAANNFVYFFTQNNIDTNKQKICRYNPTDKSTLIVLKSDTNQIEVMSKLSGISLYDVWLGFTDNTTSGKFVNIDKAIRKGKTAEWRLFFGVADGTVNTLFHNGQEFLFSASNANGTSLITNELVLTANGTYENNVYQGAIEFTNAFNANTTINPHFTAEHCGCGEVKITENVASGNKLWQIKNTSISIVNAVGQNCATPYIVYGNTYETNFLNADILRAKYQSPIAPKVAIKTDLSFEQNFVKNRVFQFAYRYMYQGNIDGIVSETSEIPLPVSDCNGNSQFSYNYIEIDFTDLNLQNKVFWNQLNAIEVLVKEHNYGEWSVIKTIERCELGIHKQFYNFYNNEIRQSIAESDAEKPFESIPVRYGAEACIVPQNMEGARVIIGNCLEDYDVPCIDATAELQYGEEQQPCGRLADVTVRIRIFNPFANSANFEEQAIWQDTGNQAHPVFGGIGSSLSGVVSGVGDDYGQYVPQGQLLVYAAGTSYRALTTQSKPASITSYVDAVKGIYKGDTVSERNDIRTAMANKEIYQEAVIKNMKAGRYTLRVASHWCSEDGTYKGGRYKLENVTANQTTSTYIYDTYDENGILPVENKEIVIDIPFDNSSSTNMTIVSDYTFRMYDLTEVSFVTSSVAFDGYMIDSTTGGTSIPELQKGIAMEQQVVEDNHFGIGTIVNSNTDHNGFVFWAYNGLSVGQVKIRSQLNFLVSGTTIKDFNQDMYEGDLDGLDSGTLPSQTDVVATATQLRTNHFIIPCYNATVYAERTILVEQEIDDQFGNPVSGVVVVLRLNGRQTTTDSNGIARIRAYERGVNMSVGTVNLTSNMCLTVNSCCLDLFNGGTTSPTVDYGDFPVPFNGVFPAPSVVSDLYAITNLFIGANGNYNWLLRGSRYQFGLVYKDAQMRRSTALTNEQMIVEVPFWSTSNSNGQPIPVITINSYPPSWAKYYSIVRTQGNLLLKLQVVSDVVRYYVWYKDSTNNQLTTFSANNAKQIRISLETINVFNEQTPNSSVGYEYEVGDVLRLVKDGSSYFNEVIEVEIRGMDGSDILIDANTSLPEIKKGMLLGIYRYRSVNDSPFYYEVAQTFPIIESGGNLFHSKGQSYLGVSPAITSQDQTLLQPATAVINRGDIYYRERTMSLAGLIDQYSYNVEAVHISDYYLSKDQSIGRFNIVDNQYGQKRLDTEMRFSNIFRAENKINGFCSFDALNQRLLPKSNTGSITCFANVNGLLLALCKMYAVSIYIGENLLSSSGDTAFVGVSRDVIGGYNILRAEDNQFTGCDNPESVVSIGSSVFWYSRQGNGVMRYTQNGVYPISNYGERNFFNKNSQYNTENEYIAGAFDVLNKEYLLAFTYKEGGTTYKSTFAFQAENSKEGWVKYDYTPKLFGWSREGVLSFINRTTWQHDSDEVDNLLIYGVTKKAKITLCSNQNQSSEKVFQSIGLETLISYDLLGRWEVGNIEITTSNHRLQRSYLKQVSFTLQRGEWRTDFNRDTTTAGVASPIVNGDVLRGFFGLIFLEISNPKPVSLNCVNIYHTLSQRTNS